MEFRCGLNRTFNVNAYRVLMSEWNVLLNFQEHYKLSQPCSIMWWNTIRLHLYSLILPGSFFSFFLFPPLSLSLAHHSSYSLDLFILTLYWCHSCTRLVYLLISSY